MRSTFSLLLLSLVFFSRSLHAEPPSTLGYSGVLFTCGPEEAGCQGYSYQGPMTFRLWSDAESSDASALVWEETQAEVTAEGGYFHVDLGSVTPLGSEAFAGSRWLEVQVGDEPPLSPRALVGAVPWAMACVDAERLGGKTAGDFALSAHTHAWGEITGKPETFPPSAHQHAWADLTGMPGVLSDGEVGWTEVTGKPSSFPPSAHSHAIGDVSGLQGALDGKSPVGHDHDGRYYQKFEVDQQMAGKEDVGVCYPKAESDGRYAAKSLEATVASLQTAVSSLEDRVTTLEKTVATQAETIEDHEARIANLETQVEDHEVRIANLETQVALLGDACPSDMMKVGDFCVDKYESSVWERQDGQPVDCKALQQAVDEAIAAGWTEGDIYYGTHPTCSQTAKTAMCNYRQYGSPPGCASDDGCDDYPAEFPDSGHWSKPLYACAIRGVMPSRSLTWFQAQQACGLSGRRLPTNAEWQRRSPAPRTRARTTARTGRATRLRAARGRPGSRRGSASRSGAWRT